MKRFNPVSWLLAGALALVASQAFAANVTLVGVDGQTPVGPGPNSLPVGAVQVIGTANVANASAVATLPAVAGVTNYMTGFEVTYGGATGAALVTVTVAGTKGGSPQYTIAVPSGATLAGVPLIVQFNPPLQATGANTAITVTAAPLGAGNTAATVVSHGYQL